MAVNTGNDRLVELLLQQSGVNTNILCEEPIVSADGNIIGMSEATCLMRASISGNRKIVRMLIEADADANMTAKNGLGPLHTAIQNARLVCVHQLLQSGANVNAITVEKGTSDPRIAIPIPEISILDACEIQKEIHSNGGKETVMKEMEKVLLAHGARYHNSFLRTNAQFPCFTADPEILKTTLIQNRISTRKNEKALTAMRHAEKHCDFPGCNVTTDLKTCGKVRILSGFLCLTLVVVIDLYRWLAN
jgi:ankyrin repeat protein